MHWRENQQFVENDENTVLVDSIFNNLLKYISMIDILKDILVKKELVVLNVKEEPVARNITQK